MKFATPLTTLAALAAAAPVLAHDGLHMHPHGSSSTWVWGVGAIAVAVVFAAYKARMRKAQRKA
ncbi:MAG: hypothetical protein ACSHWZ_14165 [Sulfitobacter sp.]